jgi:transcriptional regulator with XRE-family HTH domain
LVPVKKAPPSPERKKFGRKVARLRSGNHLTQEKLAEMVGLSARHMQAIEAGDYWPTLPTLRKLRSALKTSWENLCDE